MNKSEYYDTEAMYLYGDKLYYSPIQVNGICMYDLNTCRNTYLYYDESENLEQRLFTNCFLIDGILYFVPGRSKNIICLDVSTNTIRKIKTNIETCRYSFAYKETIWMMPSKGISKLYSVNIHSEKVEEIVFDYRFGDVTHNVFILGEFAYISFYDRDSLLKFNVINHNVEWINIDKHAEGFSTLNYDGERIWLSDKLHIYRYEFNNGLNKCIGLNGKELSVEDLFEDKVLRYGKSKLDEFSFYRSFFLGKSIIFISRNSSRILKLNIENELFSEIEVEDENESIDSILREDRITPSHYFAKEQENVVLLYSMVSQKLYLIDKESEEICNTIRLKRDLYAEKRIRKEVVIEDKRESFISFLNCV